MMGRLIVVWSVLCCFWQVSGSTIDKSDLMFINSISRNNAPPPTILVVQDPCKKKAVKGCVAMQDNFSNCFGAPLPYTFTSNELVNDQFAQYQLHDEMMRWQGLRHSPKCWSVLQPLLCFLYKPKCEDDFIELPSQKLCHTIKKHCGVIKKAMKKWPSVLDCEDSTKFSAQCHLNDLRERRFNYSDFSSSFNSVCMEPLTNVASAFNHYPGFEGCAFNCSDPLFSREEQEYVSLVIKWTGLITGGVILFVLFTSVIDWKSTKQYPTVYLFYTNFWYGAALLGWMLQFVWSSTKEDIICRKDATIKRNEPDAGENIMCPMVFVLIYFGVMSSLAWLCVFAYVWNLTCKAVGHTQKRIYKEQLYYRVFAILVPVILTTTCLSMNKLDASSISGVCFVGVNDTTSKITLLVLPLTVAFTLIMFFFWSGINRLRSLYFSSSELISDQGRREIIRHGIRVGVISAAMLVVLVISLVFQFRFMAGKTRWEKSLEEFMICKMNLQGSDAECELGEKADVGMVTADVVMFFVGGLLLSSWAFTGATLRIWMRFLKRAFRCDSKEGEGRAAGQLQKHQLISQAFAKRHQIAAKGGVSVSLQSLQRHGDLMGMNKLLDPNLLKQNAEQEGQQMAQSMTGTDGGTDMSSDWAAALPHLLSRRGALIPPQSSNSVSCMSEDNSRWPSMDSNMSEMSVRKKRSYRNLFSRRQPRSGAREQRGRRGFWGSSFSLGSTQRSGSQILPAIMALITKNIVPGAEERGREMTVINPQRHPQPPKQTTLIVKEIGVQTSFEKLPTPKHTKTVSEKGTQSSLVTLNEIGTQTKKSATKKKEKKDKAVGGEGFSKIDNPNHSGEDEDMDEDPISKLLTPI